MKNTNKTAFFLNYLFTHVFYICIIELFLSSIPLIQIIEITDTISISLPQQ